MRLFLALALSACAAPEKHIEWHYGEPWGGTCADGKRQSPVELSGSAGFAPKVQLEYWPSRVKLLNNGHTVQANYDPGSTLIVDGKRFALQQFHFHHPGEHGVDGKSFPLEMHFVNKSEDGKLAVIGVLVIEGAANNWLKPLFADLPRPGESRELDARVNAADLVPRSRIFLHYSGSLTTPPCSEDVAWFVLRTPIEMSADQIAALAKLLPDNHRPIQPPNGRAFVEGEAH
jgi:carbonic anhydrase